MFNNMGIWDWGIVLVIVLVLFGGKKLPELEALQLAYMAIQCGAAGVDMGRNVFQSDAPLAMLKAVAGVVHDNLKPAQAFDLYNTLKQVKEAR